MPGDSARVKIISNASTYNETKSVRKDKHKYTSMLVIKLYTLYEQQNDISMKTEDVNRATSFLPSSSSPYSSTNRGDDESLNRDICNDKRA